MKKKWLSVVALCMCFSMGMSTLASCGGNGGSGSGGGNSQTSEQGGGNGGSSNGGNESTDGGNGGGNENNGGGEAMTDEAILAKIVEAAEASKAYTGAYTMIATGTDKEKVTTPDGETGYVDDMVTKISVDAAAGKLVLINTSEETENGIKETQESILKYFKEGDKAYSYMQQREASTEEGAEEEKYEMYSEVSEIGLKMALSEYSLKATDYFDILEMGLTAGMNIAAYNEAYATIIADSKAAIALEVDNEESKWYQASVDASVLISCSVADGAYSVSTKVTMTATTLKCIEESVQEMIITAKDGKIVSIKMEEESKEVTYRLYYGESEKEYTEVPAGTEGAIQVMDEDEYDYVITMDYAFSETEFNAVGNTLPTDASQIMPANDYLSKRVEQVINGVEWGNCYLSGQTVAAALGNMSSTPYGMDVVWYKDAAYTQPLDETLTVEEFLAMDTIYGKATAKEGYVIYTTESSYTFADDVTDAYKMIYANMMGGYKNISATMAGEGEWMGISLYRNSENEVITVNDVVIEFAEGENSKYYTVVEGQTYVVKKTTAYTMAELNFFDMMF